jgi:hypothetical protein
MMMSLRNRLRAIERRSRADVVEIPQHDGTVERFAKRALKDAFLRHCARMGAGPDAPPEHPLCVAAKNSPDPEWRDSFFVTDGDKWTEPIEDLSEGA